jgi:hypothetical protein
MEGIAAGLELNDNEGKIFALRKTKFQGAIMINICDIGLVGSIINKNDFEINISKDFFLDETISENEAKRLLKSSSIMNLVGENIVNLAITLKLAKSNSVKVFDGIPFLMIYSFMGNY